MIFYCIAKIIWLSCLLQRNKKITIDQKEIELCKIFQVQNSLNMEIRSSIPTLTDLIDYFSRLDILNKQDIDDEWRSVGNIELPKSIKQLKKP